jgi:geranylgeranyl reductase family protein
VHADFDVIVVGAGPGGATASRACAQGGLRTLLIEKERFPRYKACGGCLSVKTVHLLGFDLTTIVENTVSGAKFTYGSKDPLLIPSTDPIGYMVMRDRFDHFLVVKAIEAGVEFLEGKRVIEVKEMEGKVEVALEGGEMCSCVYLVGADGAGSLIASSLSPATKPQVVDGVGLESEVPFDQALNFCRDELHLVRLDFGRIPYGYGWVFPKKEHLSIGVGGRFVGKEQRKLHRHFTDFIRGLGFLGEGKVDRLVGHRIPSFYSEGQAVACGNIVLVGDAAHLIDPLTGEGIYYAVRSGMLAARAILRSHERGERAAPLYQNAIRGEILENLKWSLHVARIIYRFPKLAYRTLKQYPELGDLCIHMLGGKTTYQSFVARVKERIKDLLGGKVGEKIRRAMATS